MAFRLIDALGHPGVMTPTVAPERFYNHEVIVKALMCVHIRVWGCSLGLFELRHLIPCGQVRSMR
jgi:hypothetical protein